MKKPGVWLDYATARNVLYVIEALRGGPDDQRNPNFLNALMVRVARGLPDEELPEHLLTDAAAEGTDEESR
jgi:hypothetical protein